MKPAVYGKTDRVLLKDYENRNFNILKKQGTYKLLSCRSVERNNFYVMGQKFVVTFFAGSLKSRESGFCNLQMCGPNLSKFSYVAYLGHI